MKSKIYISILMAVVIALFTAGQAGAQLIYELDTEFSSNTDPASVTLPWLTATFEDTGANQVQLTMTADNLTASEFASRWFFNFDPGLTLADLTITEFDLSAVGTTNVIKSENNLKADGDGFFDIEFDFPPPGSNRFVGGESVIYNISYGGAGSFDVSSFLFDSVMGGGQGTYGSAAHVQGIAPTGGMCGNGLSVDHEDNGGSCSGWIGNSGAGNIVPEPISSTLFLIGGTFLAGRRFLRRKK